MGFSGQSFKTLVSGLWLGPTIHSRAMMELRVVGEEKEEEEGGLVYVILLDFLTDGCLH